MYYESGLFYGYFPEPNKSCFIVKEPFLTHTKQLFQDLTIGIKITTSGRFLGGVIDYMAGKHAFITDKDQGWLHQVETLSLSHNLRLCTLL